MSYQEGDKVIYIPEFAKVLVPEEQKKFHEPGIVHSIGPKGEIYVRYYNRSSGMLMSTPQLTSERSLVPAEAVEFGLI